MERQTDRKEACSKMFKAYVSQELTPDMVETYHSYIKKNCDVTEGDLRQARNPRELYRY